MSTRLDCAIIGAPKSGTSSLYLWLAAHPEVSASVPKETYYFMDRDHPLADPDENFNAGGWDAFERYFPDRDSGKIRLEATVHHIYQKTARNAFCSEQEPPLVIAVLREPAEQIKSAFHFTRNHRGTLDPALSFASFVDHLLEDKTEDLRRFFRTEEAFYILSRALTYNQYVTWLDPWFERLAHKPPEVLLLEELRSQPLQTMKRVCRRLDIDPGFYSDYPFTAANVTRPVRSFRLRRLAHFLAPLIPAGPVRNAVRGAYSRFQRSQKPARHAQTDQEAMRRLRLHFEPWNRQLARGYDCDLDYWR